MLVNPRPPRDARDRSPIAKYYDEKGNVLRYPQMVRNGNGKIHRIPLKTTASVEYLCAESPSRVWVRITNHITDALCLVEPCELKKANNDIEIRLYDYYMAPIEERVYARSRVVEIDKDDDKKFMVLFIDYGVSHWVRRECLAELPDDLWYHPWQAILVSVIDFMPIHGVSQAQIWTEEQRSIFRDVISRFERFKVKALMGSAVQNDSRSPIKVELIGLSSELDTIGKSISVLFCSKLSGKMVPRVVGDASKVEIDESAWFSEIIEEEVVPFRAVFPVDWKQDDGSKVKQLDQASVWKDWSPESTKIKPLTVEWLRGEGYFANTSCFLASVESLHSKSPYEWYARPIMRTDSEITDDNKAALIALGGDIESESAFGGEIRAMILADEELQAKAELLDGFYGLSENRHPHDKEQMMQWLREKEEVYGIVCVSHSYGQFTGEWQRVQVLECNQIAKYRFLDTGGISHGPPGGIFKIHPEHCKWRPLCAHFALHGYRDSDPQMNPQKGEWSNEAKSRWLSLLRNDIPVEVLVLDRGDYEMPQQPQIFDLPHVIWAKSVRVCGGETPITDDFVRAAVRGRAAIQEDAPFKWSY